MFHRAFLCSIPAALNFTALRGPSTQALNFAKAADRLRTDAVGLSSVEYGLQNGDEHMNHGFTHCAIAAATAPGLLASEAVEQFKAELTAQCSGRPLDVTFGFAEPVPQIEAGQIRHLVLWRFDEAKVAAAGKTAEGTPVDVAVAGYRQLPVKLPGYFAHLDTAPSSGKLSGTDGFPLNEGTIVLYSTFFGKTAQQGFVEDDRRKSWKAEFVSPYLDVQGTLDFDFSPGVV